MGLCAAGTRHVAPRHLFGSSCCGQACLQESRDRKRVCADCLGSVFRLGVPFRAAPVGCCWVLLVFPSHTSSECWADSRLVSVQLLLSQFSPALLVRVRQPTAANFARLSRAVRIVSSLEVWL